MLYQVIDLLSELAQVVAYHVLLEVFLFLWISWLLYKRYVTKKLKELGLTKEEEEELLAEWRPEPLVPPYDENHPALTASLVCGKAGKYITVNGQTCLDMATHNYLGMAGNANIEKAAEETVRKYGVGSCGPRAFYGTTDVHIKLEERLAKFLNVEQTVSYSYAFSTLTSAIPAYAKKGDIIFVDEGVNFALQRAMIISKSKVEFFRHNDSGHLEELLERQALEDKKHPKAAKVSRRFLLVEGIYMNTGDVCDIESLVPLKRKYKLRFFVDESVSFGTLGKSGRGITEYRNIDHVDIDVIVGSFEGSMGSVGGFVAGTSYVVDHQILAGLGYMFSASLPPLLATAVIKALDRIDDEPELLTKLQENAHEVQNRFSDIQGLTLSGDFVSPVKHLTVCQDYMKKHSISTRDQEKVVLRSIIEKARDQDLALVMAAYLDDAEMHPLPVSIRLTVSCQLDEEDICWASGVLNQCCEEVFAAL